ncbi:MAG TPA: hypothetical protein VFI27_09340 [candidate division Zixibacteria bacterium]|nr:hypothetical protein [candidate division Zixibacteria bacterium]
MKILLVRDFEVTSFFGEGSDPSTTHTWHSIARGSWHGQTDGRPLMEGHLRSAAQSAHLVGERSETACRGVEEIEGYCGGLDT